MPHLSIHQTASRLLKWCIHLSVALAAGLSFEANASVLTIQPDTTQINPLSSVEIFRDPTGALDIDQIVDPTLQKQFKNAASAQNRELNFGFTSDTYWIKLTLARAPEASGDWVLEIPYLNLNKVIFYAPKENPVQIGTDFSSANKPIFYPLYALPIQLTVQPQTYYLQIQSEYALTIPMMLRSRAAFSREFSDTLLLQAIYFGGLLSLALYNFLLFLSLKDRSYLYYTLFALTLGMGMFAGNGYGRLYIWPTANAWDMVAQTTFFSLAGALSLCFTCSFLRTSTTVPRVHKWLVGFSVGYLIAAALLIASVLGGFSPTLAFQLALSIALPATLFGLLAAIRAYQSGNRSALYFLLASVALWIGANVSGLRVFDLVPTNGLTLYALQIGSSLEMLLLSFALAHRIHTERDQRIHAQEATIRARNELLGLAKETEIQLEAKVLERTQKLQEIALNEKNIRQQYVRFGAMIAHEFRNPLGIIETQSTLIQREHQLGIDKITDRTETLLGATHRLAKLFNQWLKSDQLEAPISQLHTEKLLLAELINPVFKSACEYHREFKISMQSVPMAALDIDQSLLEIALLNLIDNACKYSPRGSSIKIQFASNEHKVGIIVSDCGPGIPADQLDKIFKAYVRIGDPAEHPGFGLGLAFVAHIAELHHGNVNVQSKLGAGSEFTLWIPCL